ncbi:hypothetical protein RJT34_16516 [Clitoria ternatea]|uniref:Histone H2A n=1 Tax=Clitoria ternatea TaxID=43366 RepID=A0AAN9PDQ7_CLITE
MLKDNRFALNSLFCVADAFPCWACSSASEVKGDGQSKSWAKTTVYSAAILEYITVEVLELAGNASKDLKVKLFYSETSTTCYLGGEKLDTLIKGTIAGGGVIPHIHK